MESEEKTMNEEKMFMAELIAVFVFDFVLFCTDVIMTSNSTLWLTIHVAEGWYMIRLMKNSVSMELE